HRHRVFEYLWWPAVVTGKKTSVICCSRSISRPPRSLALRRKCHRIVKPSGRLSLASSSNSHPSLSPGYDTWRFWPTSVAPIGVMQMGEAQAAARTLGLEVTRLEIVRSQDIAPALETLKGRAQALYVVSEALVFTHRTRIHTLATAARLPTMHDYRE